MAVAPLREGERMEREIALLVLRLLDGTLESLPPDEPVTPTMLRWRVLELGLLIEAGLLTPGELRAMV